MRISGITRLLVGVCIAGIAVPALSQDVIMRRPLARHATTSDPSTGTPPPTQSPSVSPSTSPSDSPSTSPSDNPSNQPGDTCEEQGNCYVQYFWDASAWSGSATCGQQSHMTRDLLCDKFEETDSGYKDTYVPVADCEANGADDDFKPPLVYDGTDAGCDYHYSTSGVLQPWTIDKGYPGTAVCSDYAYQETDYPCVNAQNQPVDDSECFDPVDPGAHPGQMQPDPTRVYGNYSGCTSQWVGKGSDYGCTQNGDDAAHPEDTTTTHYAYYTYVCQRADGKVMEGVDEAACPIDDRPFDGPVAIGTCRHQNDPSLFPVELYPSFAKGGIQDTCHNETMYCGSSYYPSANGCADTAGCPQGTYVASQQTWVVYDYHISNVGGHNQCISDPSSATTCYNPYVPADHNPIPDLYPDAN